MQTVTQGKTRWLPGIKSLGFLMGALYAVICVFTMHNYGMGPDDPYSYFRGERIFQYFLSGDYAVLDWWSDMEEYTPYERAPGHPRFAKNHPDISSANTSRGYNHSFGYIVSAASCYLFYRTLGWTDAITAHRLSNIFFGALLVAVLFCFGAEAIGPAAGLFAVLAAAFYPRLYVLVQGNVKDVPMLSMYALTVWSGWHAAEKDDWRWLIISALALGMAVGSKSTGGFAFLLLLIYFLVRQIRFKKLPSKSFLCVFVCCPLISYGVVFASNPSFWPEPRAEGRVSAEAASGAVKKKKGAETPRRKPPATPHVPKASLFEHLLKELKRATDPNSSHSHWHTASMPGWTTIRARFAFFVTPVVTILLAAAGLAVCWRRWRRGQLEEYLIFPLWLFLPLLRTAMPYSVAYGGIRLYVDYVPGLCLLAGLGGHAIIEAGKRKGGAYGRLAPYALLASFLPISYKMVDMHPYQAVFFNFLLGGNKGAMESKYPFTGDVHHTSYARAMAWLNEKAEEDAVIVAVNTHLLNGMGLRRDLKAVSDVKRARGANDLYYLAVPISWTYRGEIPWPEENRVLVKEATADGAPVWLVYKCEETPAG